MSSPDRHTVLVEFRYPGAPFHGLQPQPGQTTAGGTLMDLVAEVLVHPPKGLSFAARTDRYVSALQNYATFWVRGESQLEPKLASLVGRSRSGLCVLSAQVVPRSVNARNSPVSKHYRYVIRDGVPPYVAQNAAGNQSGQAWEIVPRLDIALMARATQVLLGTHDFGAFRVKACSAKTTTRRLDAFSVSRQNEEIVFEVQGNGFLRRMVRRLVGTVAEVGAGLRPVESISELLSPGSDCDAGMSAPGHGLCLVAVELPLPGDMSAAADML